MPRTQWNTFQYLRQVDAIDYGDHNEHGHWWAISKNHPYMYSDSFWKDAPGTNVVHPVEYMQFRWPPVISDRAYNDPDQALAPDHGTGVGSGTQVPSVQADILPAGGSGPLAIEGINHILGKMTLHGHFAMCKVPSGSVAADRIVHPIHTMPNIVDGLDASHPLGAGTAANYIQHDDQTSMWMRIVVVQQFKEKKDTPDIKPSDVFEQPVMTPPDDNVAPMVGWPNIKFLRKRTGQNNVKVEDENVSDPDQDVADTRVASALGTRAYDFKVHEVKNVRLSATLLNGRRMIQFKESLRIDRIRHKMSVLDTDLTDDLTAQEITLNCDNPVFIWVMVSNDPWHAGETTTADGMCMYHRRNVAARWAGAT